jgi:DNA segregation ATPase FtsK/SpoIIIE, S-DNA-T family
VIGCKFPEHHRRRGGVGLVLLGLVALAVWRVRHVIAEVIHWTIVTVLVLAAAAVVFGIVRAIVHVRKTGHRPGIPHVSAAWLRHVPRALWAICTWRWVARNLALAAPDRHRAGRVRRPRALIWPHRHGVSMRIRTTPGTGRVELEAVAQHLADHLRVARVSVTQPRPGRLRVRALVRDPLLELLSLADAPAADPAKPYLVWLGRDEHGADRYLDLRNVSGVCVGGQPGGGKSQGITSWETQLAPSPAVQFANIDGKGAGEFDDFEPRAWITSGDDMDLMLIVLEQLTGLMYDRLAAVRDFTGGKKNIWTVGVSPEWPLQFSVFDETQQFFDLPAAKALGKDQERACAQAIKLGGELVRKGRSVGMCSVFATQKPTSDSLPSSISANCALSVAYSLKTLDAAKATLGPDIGEYPALSPVSLSLPDYTGVCVVSLRDGMAPFTRLRAPLVTEDQAAAVARASAGLCRDPRASLPTRIPDDASELV